MLIRPGVSQHNIQNIQVTIQNYLIYKKKKNKKRKTQSIDANSKMIQMLKLSDKNFRAVLRPCFVSVNTAEINRVMFSEKSRNY